LEVQKVSVTQTNKHLTILISEFISYHKYSIINVFFTLCICDRGNTKESYEGDGDSRTHFIPSQEPLTGISHFEIILSIFEFELICIFWLLLQKYRLGKSQQVETCSDNKQGELLYNSNRMIGSFLIWHNLEFLINGCRLYRNPKHW
jgi:hypothetical protein